MSNEEIVRLLLSGADAVLQRMVPGHGSTWKIEVLAALRRARNAGAADEMILGVLLALAAGLLSRVKPGSELLVRGAVE